jgi:hypothetical protein
MLGEEGNVKGDFKDPGDSALALADLAAALSAYGDALTVLSLALRDHLFEVDADGRKDAGAIEQELTEKLREQMRQSR